MGLAVGGVNVSGRRPLCWFPLPCADRVRCDVSCAKVKRKSKRKGSKEARQKHRCADTTILIHPMSTATHSFFDGTIAQHTAIIHNLNHI
jgi:hypothetical protein